MLDMCRVGILAVNLAFGEAIRAGMAREVSQMAVYRRAIAG
jgi:hypothetical protein